MSQIHIAISEDIPRLAEALRKKILLSPGFQVVHIAGNGEELLDFARHHKNLDVVLMDIQMPVMDGIEATRKLKERYPQIKVIMSTVFDDDENLFRAIMAGASGYLLKDESPGKIHHSIEMVMQGGAPMSAGIASKVLNLIRLQPSSFDEQEDFGLTPRELEILKHLSKGLSYDQIAGNLFISSGTVRKHIENIYKKLQVHNKVEALQLAMRNRLI